MTPLTNGSFVTYREEQMRILFQDAGKLVLTKRYGNRDNSSVVYADPNEIKPLEIS